MKDQLLLFRGPRRDKGASPRQIRRAMLKGRMKPDRRKQPFARLGRAKVKPPQFILEANFRQDMRRALSAIKLAKLVPECPEMKYLVGVPGLRNVWQLSQAPTEWIKAIPGLGPARRRKVWEYLRSKNVPLRWEA